MSYQIESIERWFRACHHRYVSSRLSVFHELDSRYCELQTWRLRLEEEAIVAVEASWKVLSYLAWYVLPENIAVQSVHPLSSCFEPQDIATLLWVQAILNVLLHQYFHEAAAQLTWPFVRAPCYNSSSREELALCLALATLNIFPVSLLHCTFLVAQQIIL